MSTQRVNSHTWIIVENPSDYKRRRAKNANHDKPVSNNETNYHKQSIIEVKFNLRSPTE
jgi:hypothetical protein